MSACRALGTARAMLDAPTRQCPTKPSYDPITLSAGVSYRFMALDNLFVRLVWRTAFRYLVVTALQAPRATLHDSR
uniref:Outer membrane insertion C-terminal signal n=1 Tax=Burkholderia sp. (strain CCGE1003) TaxID=640512 RepID=E1TJD4_BURSG